MRGGWWWCDARPHAQVEEKARIASVCCNIAGQTKSAGWAVAPAAKKKPDANGLHAPPKMEKMTCESSGCELDCALPQPAAVCAVWHRPAAAAAAAGGC